MGYCLDVWVSGRVLSWVVVRLGNEGCRTLGCGLLACIEGGGELMTVMDHGVRMK